MALSTRFSWSYITSPEGGVQIHLLCLKEDVGNPRSAKAGAIIIFPKADAWMQLPYGGIQSLESHMQTLTDDQCDSFYPQERVKKKKKDAQTTKEPG